MAHFNFFQPVQIRYNDIDAQGHVNNAKFVTFIEFARFRYLTTVGLWDGMSFMDLGLIVADVHINYLAPIKLFQNINVGVKVSKIGNKSISFIYQIEDSDTRQIMATAETIMVSFDYLKQISTPVSKRWRDIISKYEDEIFE